MSTPVYLAYNDSIILSSVVDPTDVGVFTIPIVDAVTRLIVYVNGGGNHLRKIADNFGLIDNVDYFISLLPSSSSYLAYYLIGVDYIPYRLGVGTHYVDYDGSLSADPVNQVPEYTKWMKYVATLAHELDTMYQPHTYAHTLGSNYKMSPDLAHSELALLRNQNTLQYCRGLIGQAFAQLKSWAAVDPQRLFGGSDIKIWKFYQERIHSLLEQLCFLCDSGSWPRKFLLKHGARTWRAALDEVITEHGRSYMRIPVINKSGSTWEPSSRSIVTMHGNNLERSWQNLIESYAEALNYYDDNYNVREPVL